MEVRADLSWGLIVVDNNSSDDTRAVVDEFVRTSNLQVRYIFEGKQGKSHALNTGIREARGEIIAFTDDDVYPEPDWLTVIWREFTRDRSLQVISGRVELFNAADLPIAVRRSRERTAFHSPFDAFNVMAGGNSAVRRELFDRIGFFDPDFGPGARWPAAEDADFFYRAWRAGLKLVYEPAMSAFHNHGRRTLEAEKRIRRSYTVGRGAFYAKHTLRRDWSAPRAMYWELLWVLRNRDIKTIVHHMAWLLRGFIHYVLVRSTKVLTRTNDRSSGPVCTGR
jgi:hypothetical protein